MPAWRLAPATPDGVPVGGWGNPAVFGFYANKQITTGEGGMVTLGDPGMKAWVDSGRNQGRAPNMDRLDHDRLGFNDRLSDIACALGLTQLEVSMTSLPRGPAWQASTARRWRTSGVWRPMPRHGGQPPRLVCVRGVDPPPRRSRCGYQGAGGGKGVKSKPYLPAIHLMRCYRERFGHQPGDFPICEDVAACSIALPFFVGMEEWQVRCVVDVLRDAVAW